MIRESGATELNECSRLLFRLKTILFVSKMVRLIRTVALPELLDMGGKANERDPCPVQQSEGGHW